MDGYNYRTKRVCHRKQLKPRALHSPEWSDELRLVLIVIFSSISFAQLPKNIEALIGTKYPTSTYPSHEMYSTYWKWMADEEAENDPYFGIADFNGDGIDDYAILLIIDSTLRLVVLNSDELGFDVFELYKPIKMYSQSRIDCGIFVESPGDFMETKAGRKRELKTVKNENFGIRLKFFETSSMYFYWEKHRFKHLWVSD